MRRNPVLASLRLVFVMPLVMACAASAWGAQPVRGPARSAVERGVGVYRVSTDARPALLAMGALVHHGRVDGQFTAELTEAQARALRDQGFTVTRVYASVAEAERALREQPAFEQFHTFDQMRSDFLACAAEHANIAQYVVLGHSVQGRELFGLCISSHPGVEEDEPELVYWGGIHGDEYGGMEVPYRYALRLCDAYGTDPTLTQFVDDNEIWCIPIINPDGRAAGTRVNANGIDLNRDLGYEWSGEGASPAAFSQVETRAIREFCQLHNVTLSTTFHCSGNVVFYPWGYAPQDVPDLAIIRGLSQSYASAASYTFGNSFDDYETHGEVIDYVYGSHGAVCLTIEVSNSAAQITQTIARNQAGLDLLSAEGGEGIHGMVTDAQTGTPLAAAVWIRGDPIPAYTDPGVGDLHRVVPSGTYDVTVWANGHAPQSITGLVTAQGAPAAFAASLPAGGGEFAFRVVSVNQKDPNHAHVNATFPSAALGAPDGVACSIGTQGFIVLDFGAGHEIVNRPGPDFRIVELALSGDTDPESYVVYAGDAYSQTTLIGNGIGTADLDLAWGGLASARYLRITGVTGGNPNSPFAGMDLDAVIANINDPAGAPLAGNTAGSGLGLTVVPNPFRQEAAIRFRLASPGTVTLSVFDASGRRVGSPSHLENAAAGPHELRVDGSGWSAGAYYYRVEIGGTRAEGGLVRVR